jgi:hypothetical protein
VAFVVTSGKPSLGSGYFNLSSVPTSTPSANWQAVAAAWRTNQTTPFEPVESMSVAVCSPKYFVEPWIIDLVNGSTKLVEMQSQSVGNLDITQLNIAIQDCFKQLPSAPPISLAYGLSIAQLTMLFTVPLDISLPGIPYPSENVTFSMNVAIPSSVQAYLDNFPFGDFVPPQSKLLVPALVLSAELNFVCATAALYALLSAALLYSFWRPAARPFTIQNVLSVTRKAATAHAHDVARGRGVVSMIERISISGNGMDDATTEARINKLIGNRYTMILEDQATRHLVLEIDSQSHGGTPHQLLERYENVRTHRSRIIWAFTPALGVTLVGFGLAAWRHPHIISHSPQNARATLFSALFTWGLGLWRSLSLIAISALVRQANSDVSIIDDKNTILAADTPPLLSGVEPPDQKPKTARLEPQVARDIQPPLNQHAVISGYFPRCIHEWDQHPFQNLLFRGTSCFPVCGNGPRRCDAACFTISYQSRT